MRLVLIDSESNRVCGDTASLAPRFPAPVEALSGDGNVEGLAKTVARLLDESLGKTYRIYSFTSFAPPMPSRGYFIFRCDCEGDRAPLPVSDQSDQDATIAAVMMGCFYVGYVLSGLLIL
jgi:hypothetical protein